MATFKPTIIRVKNKKDGVLTYKQDGTINCVIRVTHNRISRYIKTTIYISPKQLNKAGDIKDPAVMDSLNTIAKSYRDKIVKIADRIHLYDIDGIVDYVTRTGEDIDFIEYGRKYINAFEKKGSASNYRTVINALIDFKGDKIQISTINASFLKKFETFLLSPRLLKRINAYGDVTETKEPPVSSRTLFNYMNAIKAVFNAARLEYNNEDTGDIRIPFYPFRTYKIPSAPKSKKRNLKIDKIHHIMEVESFARDVFMISFYLCGMNTVDLYNVTDIVDGRIEYARMKTKDKRSDQAFISLKIEPELQKLIDKYKDPTGERVFDFYIRYNVSRNFTQYVNLGLKKIITGLSTYYARHSWATTARNECGVSKDVVSESLNHKTGNTVTDDYLERNWSAIDRANRAVINFVSLDAGVDRVIG